MHVDDLHGRRGQPPHRSVSWYRSVRVGGLHGVSPNAVLEEVGAHGRELEDVKETGWNRALGRKCTSALHHHAEELGEGSPNTAV